MKKALKRISIGLLIVVLLTIGAAVVVAGFFQDAVGKKLIAELNKQLRTELSVGDFELSLLSGFPDATARLRNVSVMGLDKRQLLEAEDVSFNFRLLSLFGKSVKVHTITIRKGALFVHIDSNGLENYDIFKPTEDGDAEFSISLEKAILEKILLTYQNELSKQEMQTQVETATFTGEFSNDAYTLESQAKLISNYINLDGVVLFPNKIWGYEAKIGVDVAEGTYDFNKVKVNIEDNSFKVTGNIRSQKDFKDFDLTALAEDANLSSVIAMLPEQYLNTFGDFSSSGKFQLTATVKGRSSADQSPDIELEFGLRDGALISPRLKEPFKDVSFLASFSNGLDNNRKNSVFEISNFKGYLSRELIEMKLKVVDFDHPFIEFQADGALPMSFINSFSNRASISGGKGEVEIKNLRVSGFYNDMLQTSTIMAVAMSGAIEFDDASLSINEESIVVDRGSLTFDNNAIAVEGLKLVGAGSEIHLKGSLYNLLPVLFADSLNSTNSRLEFQADLYAPKMDIGRLVKLTDIAVTEGEVKEEVFDSLKVAKNTKQERITEILKGVFEAKIDAFQYDQIEGKNFKGSLVFENKEMRILGDALAMDGSYKLDGALFFEKMPRLVAKIDCQKIDSKEFFRQTKNVGQDYLKAENISGVLNAKILVNAFWDSTGIFLTDKLHIWAGLGMAEGELKGFKLLEEFSSYAKIDDLRHVKFTNLENWLEYRNQVFYLPVMFIQNNAMNLTVSGQQTYDDRIDYNVKVNAGQVVFNKMKKNNSKLEPIKARKNGFFNMYFSITGTLDKYDYETDRRKVKDNFEKSERQKSQIRATLMKAFGGTINLLREPSSWMDEG